MTVTTQRTSPELIRSVAASPGASTPFERIVRVTRRLLDVETAIISLVDEPGERQHYLAEEGVPAQRAAEGGTHIDYSFCRHVAATGERLVVDDARKSALLSQSPAIIEHAAVAYAGAPLRLSPHEPTLGTLCVIDPRPRHWTDAELGLLEELAEVVRTELDSHVRLRAAEEVERLALRLPEPVGRLGEAVRRVSSLAEDPSDPRLPRSADVARSRIHSVDVLTQDLVTAIEANQPPAPPEVGETDLTMRVRRAVTVARAASRTEDLVVDLADEPLWVRAASLQLDRAVSHALVAALHHAVGPEPARVTLRREGDRAVLVAETPGYAIPVAEALRLVDQFRKVQRHSSAVDVSTRSSGTRVSAGATELITGSAGSRLTARLDLVRGTDEIRSPDASATTAR